MCKIIMQHYKIEYNNMINEIRNSLGRMSFTSDVWSRQTMSSHMAVTTHWMAYSKDGHLIQQSSLIAFCHLMGSHCGANLAKEFISVIEKVECLHKIGIITLDNASNNNTCMDVIGGALAELNIPFNVLGN
ncbi:hat family dimerization domain-containing protein [Moniliophthora roreri MCA 2997]|uniref:Hat family dimerization domain-containing protein n=1 Tax=Moniliophthora roreri (strain MCA 2997) TaxID=1381753 RepID=V2XJD5_MONRO|nr:hat family dimerization domain-containing protein [Moniliophthora roreri MCA 2997]